MQALEFKGPRRGDFRKHIKAPTGETAADIYELEDRGWRDRGVKDEEREGGEMLIHIFHLVF